jgi:hypothetical protein
MHIHTRTHTYIYARTHTQMHTQMHTHTHTHTKKKTAGPAIVMCNVRYQGNGRYLVEYTTYDSGAYQLSVKVLYANGSGRADPGSGTPRTFVNAHVAGSPFTVIVAPHPQEIRETLPYPVREETGPYPGRQEIRETVPYPVREETGPYPGTENDVLCPGMFSPRKNKGVGSGWEAGRGRWVHRDVCLWFGDWCGGVRGGMWVWKPHGCLLKEYNDEEVGVCVCVCM